HCPRCDQERDFQPQLAYKYGEFDLLFGFVYGRRYQLACPECHHGWRRGAAGGCCVASSCSVWFGNR
ncbi:MAG: hypothetical protein ACO1OR_09865, partial [Hydrogenophaga sp.]